MNKFYEGISNACSVLTGTFASVSIKSTADVLEIIILVLSIANILLNFYVRVRNAIKNKSINELSNAITEATEKIEKIKEENENDKN